MEFSFAPFPSYMTISIHLLMKICSLINETHVGSVTSLSDSIHWRILQTESNRQLLSNSLKESEVYFVNQTSAYAVCFCFTRKNQFDSFVRESGWSHLFLIH